jgi:alkanesulfonate monooxygenase SsuD/methylene tetrahydromethanopterin reductase-like flavin-dependent oxidoreductase (luciferase family)
MPAPTRPLHLAVAIDGRRQYSAAYYVKLARLAERGTLDFVTLDDSLAPPDDRWSRCSRSADRSVRNTRARRCATTSACGSRYGRLDRYEH